MDILEKVQFWVLVIIIPAVIAVLNIITAVTASISEKLQNEKAGKVSVFCGKTVGVLSKILDFFINKRA